MTSLMEQTVRERRWNRASKPVQPESFENAQAEIAFLKGCEAYARETIYLCLEQIENEKAYIASVEARRHKLEQLFVPVTRVALVKPMRAQPKKLDNLGDMSLQQLDEMIRLLEQLAEEGE